MTMVKVTTWSGVQTPKVTVIVTPWSALRFHLLFRWNPKYEDRGMTHRPVAFSGTLRSIMWIPRGSPVVPFGIQIPPLPAVVS